MFIIHPILFAVIPVVILYSSNLDEVPFTDILLPVVLSLAAALLLLAILRLVIKDWNASAIIVSLTLVLFYTYGRLVESFGGSVAVQIIIAVVYVALLVIGSWLSVKNKGKLKKPTTVTNAVAVTLVLISAVGIITNMSGKETKPEVKNNKLEEASETGGVTRYSEDVLPDIYYIILDGYACRNSLQKYFSYDNSEFIDYLKKKGFYVADESRSNFCQTRLSLSSSLNLEYINYFSEQIGKYSRRSALPNAMIEDNALMRFLKSKGYTFVFFGSNWSGTKKNKNADIAVTEGNWWKTEFMVALMKTTALRGFFMKEEGLYSREGVLRAFKEIPEIYNTAEEPFFLFAHIIPPHRPFLFDSEGNSTEKASNDWGDKDAYIEQLKFVNKKVETMIDEILENSKTPPVIVIQADHGPMPAGDPDVLSDPDKESADLRTGILNAYYIPDPGDLYETISPVNSFRVILNQVFGLELEVLEDRSYSSSYSKPYSFKDVTDWLR